jgi:hypothetical protein
VTGGVTAKWFAGSGNTLSNLNASNIVMGALATTYLQNNQANITSVGTLSSLSVTNGVTAGWFIGVGNTLSNINASNIAYGSLTSTGTITAGYFNSTTSGYAIGSSTVIDGNGDIYLQSSATGIKQFSGTYIIKNDGTINSDNIYSANSITTTNIISSGFTSNATNLIFNFDTFSIPFIDASSLSVSNAVTAGWFVGSGNTLSNINASNIALGAIATTYLQNNQTNITSVGTLSSLSVTNGVIAGWHVGGANTLSNINASNIALGAIATTYLQNNQTNITSVGTLSSLSVTNGVTAGWHVGGANTLSNINASNIAYGILPATTQATNLYVANTLTTTNIISSGFTSNISGFVANFDTLVIPFISSTTLNVAGISNTSSITAIDIYAANSLQTTNIYLTGGVTTASGGRVVKGALEFNGTEDVFYGTVDNLRGIIPTVYMYRVYPPATTIETTTAGQAWSPLSGVVNGTFGPTLQPGLYSLTGKIILTVTVSATTQLQANLNYTGGASYTANISMLTYTHTGAGAAPTTFFTPDVNVRTVGTFTNITASAAAAARTHTVFMDGTINVTTAGKFALQFNWNPVVPTAFTPGIRAGTYMEIRPLGQPTNTVNITSWA